MMLNRITATDAYYQTVANNRPAERISAQPLASRDEGPAACFIDRTIGAWRGSVEVSGVVALSSAAHLRVWLSHGLRGPGHRWAGEAQEGIALLVVAVPS